MKSSKIPKGVEHKELGATRLITRLTGITSSMLDEAPSREIVLQRFFDWLPSTTIVAHNAPFDLHLLRRESIAAGLKWPRLSYIDTVPLARALGETPNARLSTIAEHFAWQAETCHRARADVMILRRLLDHLLTHPRRDEFQLLLQPVPFCQN